MVKHPKTEEKRPGYDWNKKLFSFNSRIIKSYEREGQGWSPCEPSFEDLEGKWVILEFGILSDANPILGLVGESEFEYVHLDDAIDLRTMAQRHGFGLDMEWVYKVHVLEPIEVSEAKDVLNEVESEELYRARESGIGYRAHAIRKLKNRVSERRVAELINYLASMIEGAEQATDEAQIIGEKLAGGPSKVKKEVDEFVEKHDTVKTWAKAMEEKQDRMDEMTIEEILEDIKKMNEEDDDAEVEKYAEWLEILSSIRDRKIDDVIRGLYFEANPR